MILQVKQFGGVVRSLYVGFGTKKICICSRFITNNDLGNAFQMYWASKVVTLVVQFELKPGYERRKFMEEKLLRKLPGSENASQPEGDVDPAMMYDADVFVGDEQFYSALGFRDEDDARVAPQME